MHQQIYYPQRNTLFVIRQKPDCAIYALIVVFDRICNVKGEPITLSGLRTDQ
jgi:hypothetical protein